MHRDYASVLRDVANPGFGINPDYIGHVIALNDGRILTGVLQTDGDQLMLGDEKGVVTRLAKSDIESMAVSKSEHYCQDTIVRTLLSVHYCQYTIVKTLLSGHYCQDIFVMLNITSSIVVLFNSMSKLRL